MKEQAEVDLNDELLCAWLDDELDAAQRQRVTDALAADAGAQLRLQRMREADRDLKVALPLAGGDHFEAAMTARIMGGKPVAGWRRTILPWASAAAVAGLFVGYLTPHRTGLSPASELVRLSPAVQTMLEGRAAGEPTTDGMSVVLTFQARDSRYCRLFRSTATAVGEGLACRVAASDWQLTAWDAAEGASADAFRPAGASAVTDAAMTALGGQPALDPQAEAEVLQRGWRAP